tara:strand:- start:499 stop:627 length:129 start_codon:yes stop_codon:yes gene_type:complete
MAFISPWRPEIAGTDDEEFELVDDPPPHETKNRNNIKTINLI